MTRSERMLRVNRAREQRMVANALKWHPTEGQHAAAGDWERQRVANADRLHAAERELAYHPRSISRQREWLAAAKETR